MFRTSFTAKLAAVVTLFAALFPPGVVANEAPAHASDIETVPVEALQPTTSIIPTCDQATSSTLVANSCTWEAMRVVAMSVAVASAELALAVAIADGVPGDELVALGHLALATTGFAAAEADYINCVLDG